MIKIRNAFLFALLLFSVALGFASAAETADIARKIAPSLSRPASAEKVPDSDGFIPRWLILEPIRVNTQLTDSAVQAAIKTEYFPQQFTVVPLILTVSPSCGTTHTWHAVDSKE